MCQISIIWRLSANCQTRSIPAATDYNFATTLPPPPMIDTKNLQITFIVDQVSEID
jgi:hypothetical protein